MRSGTVGAVFVSAICVLSCCLVLPAVSDDSSADYDITLVYGYRFVYNGHTYGFGSDGDLYLPSGVSVYLIPHTGYWNQNYPNGCTIGLAARLGASFDYAYAIVSGVISSSATSITVGFGPFIYSSDLTVDSTLAMDTWSVDINRTPINGSASASYKHVATLVFDANGGSGAPESLSDSVTTTSSSPSGVADFTLPSTVPVRAGYEFVCWSVTGTESGTVYEAGSTVSVLYGSTTTLLAVWKEIVEDDLAFTSWPKSTDVLAPVVTFAEDGSYSVGASS